jgi:hypothetical protein
MREARIHGGKFGLMYHNSDADVSTTDDIPSTKVGWDKDYPGTGVIEPAAKGPAVQKLECNRRRLGQWQ